MRRLYWCASSLSLLSVFGRNFDGAFPLATFVINLVGSFLIGVMSVLLPAAFPNSRLPLLFVSTGILGGFTTFSTFSLETFGLIEESRYLMAGVYAFGCACCLSCGCVLRSYDSACNGGSILSFLIPVCVNCRF